MYTQHFKKYFQKMLTQCIHNILKSIPNHERLQ